NYESGKFEYDSQNRLTKYSRYNSSGELLETRTLTYSGNDLVKTVFNSAQLHEYTKSGNKITAILSSDVTQTWDLNNDGQLIKYVGEIVGNSQVLNYQYQNGNIVKYTYAYTYAEGGTFATINEYKYDNKKSPMYNCTTPQWYLIYSFKDISTTNNMIEEKWNIYPNTEVEPYEDVYEYIYEYDSDGYPTKRTSNESKDVIEYAYKEL
ncbi:MAG: hypothetical protein FWH18_12080, partial [Marinilabiliaceae bacterium]|nr:hypothetical protein [Marinilabiliaceae bacterium]